MDNIGRFCASVLILGAIGVIAFGLAYVIPLAQAQADVILCQAPPAPTPPPQLDRVKVQEVEVDMFTEDKPDTVEALWGLERLPELLAASDYVVITVPYTSKTEGMIGAEQIAQMKPGALLVGISRGKIIDEAALVEALENGHLSGAALDVFAQEPLPADSELWDMENVLITPHAAGGTQLERAYVLDIFYENMERFVNGKLPLRNQVDKVRGF